MNPLTHQKRPETIARVADAWPRVELVVETIQTWQMNWWPSLIGRRCDLMDILPTWPEKDFGYLVKNGWSHVLLGVDSPYASITLRWVLRNLHLGVKPLVLLKMKKPTTKRDGNESKYSKKYIEEDERLGAGEQERPDRPRLRSCQLIWQQVWLRPIWSFPHEDTSFLIDVAQRRWQTGRHSKTYPKGRMEFATYDPQKLKPTALVSATRCMSSSAWHLLASRRIEHGFWYNQMAAQILTRAQLACSKRMYSALNPIRPVKLPIWRSQVPS